MERIIDEKEKEYLENYSIENFERPSLATDIVVFRVTEEDEPNKKKIRPKKLQVLLIKRASYPFMGYYVLPGGFCRPNEKVEETAVRELFEETHVSKKKLRLIGVYSEPGRDPRGWIISNTYMALVDNHKCELRTDDEAWEADWFSIEQLEELDIGFDHRRIIEDAINILRYYAKTYNEKIFELLPETFTLGELQQVFEEILQTGLIKQNFRRKMMEFLEETDELETGYSHRNSKKYRKKRLQ